MAIYPDPEGPSVAIDSPRHLTLRNSRRNAELKKLDKGLITKEELTPGPTLQPGQEKLNSFWAPSLEAGNVHRIVATQRVNPNVGDQTLLLQSEQDFLVDAPQFSLPEGSVHSTYPPPGYSEEHRILPHVVLADPHLPWEREGKPLATSDEKKRNRVPWLALFTFTQDELKLPQSDLGGDMFKALRTKLGLGDQQPVKQSPTQAITMAVGDLKAITNTANPCKSLVSTIPNQNIDEAKGDFIFIRSDLFTSLFSTFDSNGKRETPAGAYHPDPTQYQYLSHVRKINGTGMALAGVEDVGVFSIVVGNRAGPLDNKTPTTVCAHLVSIEGVTSMDLPIPASQPYVAMCSLYSWNYSVLPANTLNVYDAFHHIGDTIDLLRAPDAIVGNLKTSDTMQNRLANRLTEGYSLVKHRLSTGEPTIALYRGPFTPTVIEKSAPLHTCSTSGLDLQILDKEVGIMDISYSVAWQLGRTLALGDQAFTAALGRLRTTIHSMAMKEARKKVVDDKSAVALPTNESVISNLSSVFTNLSAISTSAKNEQFAPGGPFKRWHRPRLMVFPSLAFEAPEVAPTYEEKALAAVQQLAKGTDTERYDETNSPVSSDWMIVMAWVLDRMFLSGVPAHYLISDPSHLESESLRFFAIDRNWVDCLVDGALSLGNHMGIDKDRAAIKTVLNEYIDGTPAHQEHTPQIPSHGFYFRSDLVTMFPDLKVTTTPEVKVRAPLLRHEIVTDGVMLCLLDRAPGSDQLEGIVFTQPPHQQRFAVSKNLTLTKIDAPISRQYTVEQSVRNLDNDRHDPLAITEDPKPPADSKSPDNFFVWTSDPSDDKKAGDLRILRLPHYAEYQLSALNKYMPKVKNNPSDAQEIATFEDDTATSALFAGQLTDKVVQMTIDLKTPQARRTLSAMALPPQTPDATTRQLGMLNPPKIAKLVELLPSSQPASREESLEPPTSPDHEQLADLTVFERVGLSSMSPTADVGSPFGVVPTFAAMPARILDPDASRTTAITSVRPAFNETNPALAPRFTVKAYSNLSDNPAANYVQVDTEPPPQDIVFSVRVENNLGTRYNLEEFRIKIPLGPPDPDDHKLMDVYGGPGATMLSNLRFNPLVSITKDPATGSYMLIRLLPRSSTHAVNMAWASDLSFVLSLADINVIPVANGSKHWNVDVSYTVIYANVLPYKRDGTFSIIVRKGKLGS